MSCITLFFHLKTSTKKGKILSFHSFFIYLSLSLYITLFQGFIKLEYLFSTFFTLLFQTKLPKIFPCILVPSISSGIDFYSNRRPRNDLFTLIMLVLVFVVSLITKLCNGWPKIYIHICYEYSIFKHISL